MNTESISYKGESYLQILKSIQSHLEQFCFKFFDTKLGFDGVKLSLNPLHVDSISLTRRIYHIGTYRIDEKLNVVVLGLRKRENSINISIEADA